MRAGGSGIGCPVHESFLEREVRIPRPLPEVFAFFADARNLALLTPHWVGFAPDGPQPDAIAQGVEFGHRIRVRGITLRWRSRIEVWDPPTRFVDVQLRGPFRQWRHEHAFEAVPGGTRCIDRVRYAAWGGRWIDRWLVRPDLERMFDFRRDRLLELLPAGDRPPLSGA